MISEVGGSQPGNRFVSCVRARERIARWKCSSKHMLGLFPFPFLRGGLSLFPLCPAFCAAGFPFTLVARLRSSESSEFK